ncbi:MAG: DUF4493 domain-containing protein [Muribaculaceae bacterium]|nr:DUF4493 domain-containing protein [Muribaculaceae bacterium]
MNYLKQGILLGGTLLMVSACNEAQWEGPEGRGGIALHLTASGDVTESRRVSRAPEDAPFTLPDVADFSISLTKIDNSYSRTWEKLADFEAENGFPSGAYTLRAFYGDIENEGVESPCFEGTAEVSVLEGRETEASLTAHLANTMVSVDYTEAARGYFRNFTATLHSEGHAYVDVPSDEKRPVFLVPGDVSMTVDFTDVDGRTAKVRAASFTALPAHHYHLTVDVNGGNVGDAVLTVNFDELLEVEDVEIDLTEELFTTKAPLITPEGFTDSETLGVLANSMPDAPVKMSVLAYGGLASARLTLESTTMSFPTGNEVELVGASSALQSQLSSLGIEGMGFFRNPDRMAVLDLSRFPLCLPEGRHSATLVVTDAVGRVSDPVNVVFDSSPVSVEARPTLALFGAEETTIEVEYNGKNPGEAITFEVQNEYGTYEPAAVLGWEELPATRALAARRYAARVSVPATTRDAILYRMYFNGSMVQEISVPVTYPEYTISTDPMATNLRIKVAAGESSITYAVTNALRVFISGGGDTKVSRSPSEGMITVKGLTPGTAYHADVTLRGGDNPAKDFSLDFATEAADDVPNGDFSTMGDPLQIGGLKVGGSYRVSPADYHHTSSIDVAQPSGWASINAKTAWSGASNKNTWFIVPSTMASDGAVTLRSVAYDHNGTEPSRSGGAFNTKYYCENAPGTIASRAAGELFLGSYAFDGSESRKDGIPFASRPASVSFDYSYAPVGQETGEVTVWVADASGNMLDRQTRTLAASGSMTAVTVPLSYAFGTKAATLYVGFRSTAGDNITVNIPSGSALNEGQGLGNKTIAANSYKALATGSRLVVDNVKLNY